ncbi:MAG TPA: MBL fold metallo-hydrolase [Acetobacteraceae bacterium]|nr:MBL fold metallo-hydrolase [Acetobacteraceae bacterium]
MITGGETVPAFLCTACGTQYPPSDTTPSLCPICEDPRQYVNPAGQSWTSPESLARGHANAFRLLAPRLFAITTMPSFAIGQRAILLCRPEGNFLWDCISLLDPATEALVRALGGLSGIAISHPHYYSAMVDWAISFQCPIHLHAADRSWVMRPDPAIRFWDGPSLSLASGLRLICCGGHFAGGTVLYWEEGAGGKGALLSGDILQVLPDRRHVSFMRSFPNYWPLSASAVRRILAACQEVPFDAIYGAFASREIVTGGRAALEASAARYLAAIEGDGRAELR